jgi:hypothetical protein
MRKIPPKLPEAIFIETQEFSVQAKFFTHNGAVDVINNYGGAQMIVSITMQPE